MKRLADALAPEAPAERLAGLRILVGGFAAAYTLARLPHLLSYARFDPGLFDPVGVVSLLEQPLPAVLVWIVTLITAALGVAFAAGLGFRLTGPAFAAALLWTLSYRNSWGMVFHTENIMVLHVVVLGLAPSADTWSLDARGGDGSGRRGREYGWPPRLMAAILVATYFIAGVAKLRWGGSIWLEGEVLRNLVATDTVRKMLLASFYSPVAGAMVGWEGAFRLLAIATVVIELGAPLALLGRRPAAIWTVTAIGFHWGVQVIMMITFPYPMFGVAMACLFPVERWLSALSRRWRRRATSLPAE